MYKRWRQFTETAYFRNDMAYAGKDHEKPKSKTFIIIGPLGFEIRKGYKTLQSAMKAADKLWPAGSDIPAYCHSGNHSRHSGNPSCHSGNPSCHSGNPSCHSGLDPESSGGQVDSGSSPE